MLRRYYPAGFDRYLEPFVGSGAVFFDLCGAGRLNGRRVRLTDVNADLIGCYRAVRDEANAVIEALAGLDEEHRARGAACYYDVRDRRFNPARAALGDALADRYTPALAAMLIYLNRTGFNGLFRLNRRGEFNVPAGRYTDPRICDGAHVRAVARTFGAPGVSIEHARFDATLSDARTGDFVYAILRMRPSAAPRVLLTIRRTASRPTTIEGCRRPPSPPPGAAPSSCCRIRARPKSSGPTGTPRPGVPGSPCAASRPAARSIPRPGGADLWTN